MNQICYHKPLRHQAAKNHKGLVNHGVFVAKICTKAGYTKNSFFRPFVVSISKLMGNSVTYR